MPMSAYIGRLPYSQKYWPSLNLAILPQTMFLINTIDRFKFGGMVWYRHTNMHAEKNLAVERHTAKPPNSPAIQYALIATLHISKLPSCLFFSILFTSYSHLMQTLKL